MNKYEQLIEYIINEQEDKARELFHKIVVEKSRDIYESLIDEEDFGEAVGGNPADALVGQVEDQVQGDEEGMQEAEDDDMPELGGDDMDSDMGDDLGADMDDMGGEMGDDMGGEGDVETRVSDLESALDELKAEFEALMSQEGDDMGAEMGDDMGAEMGGDEMDMDMDMEEPKEGLVREYVEKVGKDWPHGESEGTAVGAKGEATAVNKQSIVAKPNRMGGTSQNILKGGTEQAADGKPTPTPSNEYTKKRGDLKGAGNFENVPGANTKGYKNRQTSYEKAHGKEGQTTDAKMAVDTKSLVGGKVR